MAQGALLASKDFIQGLAKSANIDLGPQGLAKSLRIDLEPQVPRSRNRFSLSPHEKHAAARDLARPKIWNSSMHGARQGGQQREWAVPQLHAGPCTAALSSRATEQQGQHGCTEQQGH